MAVHGESKVDLKSIADAAVLVLTGEQISYANGLACCVLALPFSAIEGRAFLQFVHPEDRQRIAEMLEHGTALNNPDGKIRFRLGLRQRNAFAFLSMHGGIERPSALLQLRLECFGPDAQPTDLPIDGYYLGEIVHELSQPIHASRLHMQKMLDSLVDDTFDRANVHLAASSVNRYIEYAALVTKYLSAQITGNEFDADIVDIGRLLNEICQKMNPLIECDGGHMSYQSRAPVLIPGSSRVWGEKLRSILATIIFSLLSGDRDSADLVQIRRMEISACRNLEGIEIVLKIASGAELGGGTSSLFPQPEIWDRVKSRLQSKYAEECLCRAFKGTAMLTTDGVNARLELQDIDQFDADVDAQTPEFAGYIGAVDHRSKIALVVEDQVDARNLTCDLLREMEFEVIEAGDAEQALRDVRGTNLDLIITDFGLPGLDGIALLGQLRSEGHNCPSILMSGFLNQTDVTDRLRDVADVRIVSKPADINRLEAAIIEATR